MRFYTSNITQPEIKIEVEKLMEAQGDEVDKIHELNPRELNDSYDLQEFIDDLYDFLNEYNTKLKVFKDFSFQPEAVYNIPNENEGNHLRFTVLERTDATTEQKGMTPHQGRKNYRWTLYGVAEDMLNPGYKVLVYVKPMDNSIELTSWSKNYRDANKMAFEIEKIIDTYAKIFKKKGLQELRFEGRGEDKILERANVVLYGCPLKYYVKTFQIKLVYEKILEEIVIQTIVK